MDIDFTDQIVLITGATRGIGQNLAKCFQALNATLILTGKNKTQIDQFRIKTNSKEKIEYFSVDFNDENSTSDFLDSISKIKIDVCINNAGIIIPSEVNNTQKKDLDNLIHVNLRAPFLILKVVSTAMKKNRYGKIVNIGSILAHIGKENRSAYTLTKAGIHGLTIALAVELSKYNILVNTVSPGFVMTDMARQFPKEENDSISKNIPLGRFADPDEVSKIVLFIASKQNTYLTGQNIVIDGGYSIS